ERHLRTPRRRGLPQQEGAVRRLLGPALCERDRSRRERRRPVRAAVRHSLLWVGTSGWSYPSWRPDFYPAGTDPKEFLAFYSRRFRTVELNTTGYRLPAEEQFRRWAEQTPAGFAFAPKLPGNRARMVADFSARVLTLGD